MRSYDMLAIGSGPAGQKAAIQAAKLGKKVGIVERPSVVGGVGTIPSKSLREAVLYLSGFRQRLLYGVDYSVKKNISVSDLLFRKEHVVKNEIAIIHNQMKRRSRVLFSKQKLVTPADELVEGATCRPSWIVTACYAALLSALYLSLRVSARTFF